MRKPSKEQWIIIFVSSIILVFCILFMAVLPLGHDLHFSIYRIGAMAEELKRTSFALPVRILSASYNNYGYGVPLFYGDLLLYIPAFLTACGMSPVVAHQLLMISVFLMTFFVMYKMAFRSSASKRFALLASIFYGFSSYFLIDLCIRMAVGEAIAFIFLPLVFCSFYNMLYNPLKNDWLFLTGGMTGLLLSHNLTFMFTVFILLIWALLAIRRVMRNGIWGKLILAALVTIGLTASFTFSFLEASAVQKYQLPSNDQYHMEEFPKYALDVMDFVLPYEMKKIAKVVFHLNWNTEEWHPGAVGVFLAILAVPIIKARKKQKNKVIFHAFWLSVFLYFSMYIKPFVSYLGNFLSFMQFFWRLLIFCTFSFSIYAAYILVRFFDAKWQNTYIIIAILIACYTIGPRYAYQVFLNVKGFDYIESTNPEYSDHYIMEYSPNNGDNLYLPEGVNLYLYEDRGDVVVCNHPDINYEFARSDGKCHIIVSENSYTDTTLELPLYYYKGYECVDTVTDQVVEIVPSQSKLVEVCLNDTESADLVVWYKGTFIQKIGDCISAITLLLLILSKVFPLLFKMQK